MTSLTAHIINAIGALLLTLCQTKAWCNYPTVLMADILPNHTITCQNPNSTNATLVTPVWCCWVIYPTPVLSIHLSNLVPKDIVLIDDIDANVGVVPVWHGNMSCAAEQVQKCPFYLRNVIFSDGTAMYRTIALQLDKDVPQTRLIQLKTSFSREKPPCPRKCNCLQDDYSKIVAACRNWNLTTIAALPNTTVDLQMKTGHQVASLPENIFSHLRVLTYVNLGKNNISFIDPGAFRGLLYVVKIQLHKNSISHFGPEHCEGYSTTLSSLRLDGNQLLRLQPGVFKACSHIVNLKLSRNNITKLQNATFDGLSELMSMTMEDNQIAYIELGALDGLVNLQYLDLSKNNLSTIGKYTFQRLSHLQVLMLEFNPLITIEPFAFDGLHSIQILFLNRNKQFWTKSKMSINSFHELDNLQILNTDDHRICCLLPNTDTKCNRETIPPLFDNCDARLLPTYAERLLLWIFSICALCGNTYAIVLRCKEKNVRSQTQSILILNLAISDLCMGFYMMIIAGADLYYGREFVLYAQEWTSSGLCKFAGLVSFLSSEASVLLVVLISLDRVLCVALPYGKKRMTPQIARKTIALVWVIVIALGITAIILQETTNTYGLANVCVGLPLVSNKVYETVYRTEISRIEGATDENVNLTTYELVDSGHNWQFSIAINLGLNFVAFFVVMGCYLTIGIVVAVKMPSKNIQKKNDHYRELKMAGRMAIIVLTDFCCWMPVIVMGILVQSDAVKDTKIRNNYGWIVALVLPLNAALNPYLYTFATEIRNRKRQKANDIALNQKANGQTRSAHL